MAKRKSDKDRVKEVMFLLKEDVAGALGMVNYDSIDKGALTSRANGYVGGYMTKRLVDRAKQEIGEGKFPAFRAEQVRSAYQNVLKINYDKTDMGAICARDHGKVGASLSNKLVHRGIELIADDLKKKSRKSGCK